MFCMRAWTNDLRTLHVLSFIQFVIKFCTFSFQSMYVQKVGFLKVKLQACVIIPNNLLVDGKQKQFEG